MNHIYTVVWNAVLRRFCVASELGRNRNRATSQGCARLGAPSLRPTALAVLIALAWAAPGWAQLPEGPTLVRWRRKSASARHSRQRCRCDSLSKD